MTIDLGSAQLPEDFDFDGVTLSEAAEKAGFEFHTMDIIDWDSKLNVEISAPGATMDEQFEALEEMLREDGIRIAGTTIGDIVAKL